MIKGPLWPLFFGVLCLALGFYCVWAAAFAFGFDHGLEMQKHIERAAAGKEPL